MMINPKFDGNGYKDTVEIVISYLKNFRNEKNESHLESDVFLFAAASN